MCRLRTYAFRNRDYFADFVGFAGEGLRPTKPGFAGTVGTDSVRENLLNVPLTFPPVFPRPTALMDGLALKVAGP